ncbi:MAG: PqqD family protein, partial [Desulfovibrionaceae bacterium]
AAPPERIPRGPWRPAGVVAREFAVDMERVVADLRSGLVRESYPEAACSLVFLCDHRGLGVSSLNPFGRDALALCDGENSVRDIAKTLFERYGGSMSPEAFEAECRKALDQMAGLGFVLTGLATRGANSP